MQALLLVCVNFLTIMSVRWGNYKPGMLEDCPKEDKLLNCKSHCESNGQKFCYFEAQRKGVTSYAGCLPSDQSWHCCNDIYDNHEDCKFKYGHLTLACNAEKYGDWL